jgi:hypothetical protein
VKYADDLVLLAKEETVLQGMIDRLIEIGRRYGMEINVEKTKVMRTSSKPIFLFNTVKPLSIVFQGTGKFERYIREMIVPGNHKKL